MAGPARLVLATPEDVPAVLPFLRSSDPVIASKAAHTLGRIGDGRALSELSRYPDVRILTGTTATSYHEHNVLALIEQVGDETRMFTHDKSPELRSLCRIHRCFTFGKSDQPCREVFALAGSRILRIYTRKVH